MLYYHIIDHDGFGTMHRLIKPLCDKFSNHIMIDRDSFDELIKNTDINNSIFVIHTSGGGGTKVLYSFLNYEDIKVYIFVHTSYKFQIYKNRYILIEYLKKISKKDNVKILVPSKEVEEEYKKNDIDCITVQLGIKKVENNDLYCIYNKRLEKYYNKIITTCSSDKRQYQFIKGIDTFEKVMNDMGLIHDCIVFGIEKIEDSILNCAKLNEDDFLNVLYHSKMYVQFSRMESYNITAVQAKRFKKPVFLLNAEGNNSCMIGNTYNDINDLILDINEYNNGYVNNEIIEMLYKDSIERESLENFKIQLEAIDNYE